MIHSSLTLEPSSRINLIVGANGSGKSSVVCAICLGLGGEPRDMLRESEVSKFVRLGCKTAEIEIIVAGEKPDSDVVISRRLFADKNSSEWTLNGSKSKAEDVRTLMAGLHIQMNNPCQFLPQEKVTDFTRLDPVKLLQYTEQALDERLATEHASLIDEEKNKGAVTDEIERLEKQLAAARDRKAALAKDVELFEEYQQLKDTKICIATQMTAASAESHKAEAERLRLEGEAVAANLQTSAQALTRLHDEAKQFQVKHDVRKKELADAQRRYANAMGNLSAIAEEVREIDANAVTLNEALTDFTSGRKDAESEVVKWRAKLQEAKQRLAKLPAVTQDECRAAASLAEEARTKSSEAAAEREKAAIEVRQLKMKAESTLAQLNREKSIAEARDKVLNEEASKERNARFARNARDWIADQEAAGAFKLKVFGPLIFEIKCRRDLAAQIETLIPVHIKYGFVVQCPEDQNLLRSWTASTNNRVSIFTVRPESLDQEMSKYRHPISDGELGAISEATGMELIWLTDAIECDKVVRACILRDGNGSMGIVTGDPEMGEKVSRSKGGAGAGAGAGSGAGTVHFPPRSNLVGPKTIIRYFQSQIDGSRYEAREAIRPSTYLHTQINEAVVAKLQMAYEAQVAEYKTEHRKEQEAAQRESVFRAKEAPLVEKATNLRVDFKARAKLEVEVKSATDKLAEAEAALKKNSKDVVQEHIKAIITSRRQLDGQRLVVVRRLADAALELKDARIASVIAKLNEERVRRGDEEVGGGGEDSARACGWGRG
jgi:hypothetical protein